MDSASKKWKEICFLLSETIKPHFTEKDFENQVVRALEVLGWREFDEDIVRQATFQFGRQGSMRPDLIIYGENKKALIVIEIKRPSEDIAKDNTIGQLKSYMRLLKSEFGFLVGSEIRVYYDGSLNQQFDDPLLIDKIQFERDSASGIRLVNIFNKESFLNVEYPDYIKSEISKFNKEREIKKLTNLILSKETKSKIIDFLKKEFIDYGNDTFEAALKILAINVQKKSDFPSGEKLPISKKQYPKGSGRKKIYRGKGTAGILPKPEKPSEFDEIHFDSRASTKLKHNNLCTSL